MEKDRSIRPGSEDENAVGKGKSSSRAHCRLFSGAIDLLVVNSTERITTYAAGVAVDFYAMPLHIGTCIRAPVLESPTNLVLIGPFVQGPTHEFPIEPLLAILLLMAP